MIKTIRKDTYHYRKRGDDMVLLKTAIRLLDASCKLHEPYRPTKS